MALGGGKANSPSRRPTDEESLLTGKAVHRTNSEDASLPCGLPKTIRTEFVVILLIVEAIAFCVGIFFLNWNGSKNYSWLSQTVEKEHAEVSDLKASNDGLKLDLEVAKTVTVAPLPCTESKPFEPPKDAGWEVQHPYSLIAKRPDHELPELYGKIQEKTIWTYWYDPSSCPTAASCQLPAQVQLCVESVERHKGSFDFRIVHRDEVLRYVSGTELPIKWEQLGPAQQKDSLMNALLARYGGIAWDISMILFKPLDDYWEEMVSQKASFRGYMYRWSGRPWRHEEAMAVWFLMARREGIFSTAVRNQFIGVGDRDNTNLYLEQYRALGDHTITPILGMFNYSLPKCFDDDTVPLPHHCPEKEQPAWYHGISGEERTDTKIMLSEPRDGPQLPMAFIGMELFNISDTTDRTKEKTWADNPLGSPMHDTSCSTMKACWEQEVLPRFDDGSLRFVKFFAHAHALDTWTREQILRNEDLYFSNFLKLAGFQIR